MVTYLRPPPHPCCTGDLAIHPYPRDHQAPAARDGGPASSSANLREQGRLSTSHPRGWAGVWAGAGAEAGVLDACRDGGH